MLNRLVKSGMETYRIVSSVILRGRHGLKHLKSFLNIVVRVCLMGSVDDTWGNCDLVATSIVRDTRSSIIGDTYH